MNPDDKQRNYALAERLLSEQHFAAAVIAGAVAAILAAIVYTIVVARWDFSYGFAAAGIGIAIGMPMQYLGRGIDMRFTVAAAVYAIAGCVLGNVFRVVSPGNLLTADHFSPIVDRVLDNISYVDLVFWFIAAFAAGFLAMRPLSRADRLAIGLYRMKR